MESWTTAPPASTLAWAALAGQAATVVQTVVARRSSAFSPNYLRRYLERDAVYVPAPDARGELHPVAAELERYNLHRVAMHDPSADPAPVFDILQTPDRMLTVVVGRDAGSLAFLTATNDRRILYSSDLALPPTLDTIVNWVPGGDVDTIALAHQEFIAELQVRGVEPAAAGPDVFAELMAIEHDAYGVLGTLFAPFLDIGGQRSPLGLRFAPRPEQLRERQASTPNRSCSPPRMSSVGPPSQSRASA